MKLSRIAEHVNLVCTRLDAEIPGWEWLIDVDRLNLVDARKNCVAAQLGWPKFALRDDLKCVKVAFCMDHQFLRTHKLVQIAWLDVLERRLTKNLNWFNPSRWYYFFKFIGHRAKL